MTVFDQMSRPFNWLRALKASFPSHPQRATPTTTAHPAYHPGRVPAQQVQVIGEVIKLPRRLDATSYQEVIQSAQQLHQDRKADHKAGNTEFVVDLHEVEQIDIAGFFALHCVAMLARGESIPDPELGWRALRMAAERNERADGGLRLINVSAQMEALLRTHRFDRFLMRVS